MLTPNEFHKIAVGANNEGNLKAWHRLNPPLFRYYDHPQSEGIRRPSNLTADQVYKTRGKNQLILTFPFWSPQEMDWFIATFFPNDEEDVKVTIRGSDKQNQTWANYNADMKRPEYRDQDDNFYDVVITFRNLTELP